MAGGLGLSVTGSLGLLVKAKNRGHLNAVEPYIDRLIEYGSFYSAEIIETILKAVGERPQE